MTLPVSGFCGLASQFARAVRRPDDAAVGVMTGFFVGQGRGKRRLHFIQGFFMIATANT